MGFFKKLANFCNLHFVDLDEDNDFIYEGIPFSLLLKFILLIKNNDGFMIIRSKHCSLELLEQVKTFMICEKIDTAIADELKIAKILNQIRIQEEIKRLSIKLRLEWQENQKEMIKVASVKFLIFYYMKFYLFMRVIFI